MKKRMNRVSLVLTMTFILFAVSACGNKPSAETLSNETEIEESTIETVESEEETVESSAESEETEPIQSATGHQHNIEIEEKMNETDAEEEVQEEERKEEVQSQTAVAEKTETEVQTQTSTTETTTAPTTEQTTVTAPSTPDMSQLEEWMPPINMLVVRDANVVDENGNVLGSIAKGSDIGVTGQCPGFYQVNYGAKRSFLPTDCLSSR